MFWRRGKLQTRQVAVPFVQGQWGVSTSQRAINERRSTSRLDPPELP
jgi:hypothetical protein